MNRLLRLAPVALLLLAGGFVAGAKWTPAACAAPPPPLSAEVHFSPHGGCTAAVAGLIGEAKKTVQLQAYSFTSRPVLDALIAAQGRGVDVDVVLDKSDAGHAEAEELAAAGVRVFIDRAHAIAHNKVIVVDGAIVETGSFNFTKAAEAHNAENCLVLRGDPGLARAYADNWASHRAHSEPAH